MGLLILVLILVLLAMAGVLGFVVKVALGIALGLVAAAMIVAWLVRRRVRRFLFGSTRKPPGAGGARWRQVPGSTVEVLDHHAPKDPPA
jgi:hypothetical protein